MCGLLGVVGAQPGLLDASLVQRLFAELHHRGPDDRGWLALDRKGVRAGSSAVDLEGDAVLLHTRLSILDLSSAGHQPMSTSDGRYHLSFNGEIYNYLELRNELEQLGHTFVSGTDTEVLLAAYAQWGAAALGRLIGMFAFAIVDAERRLLVLARDHFGIKPLYYAPLPHGLAFASEIQPLLEVPGVRRRANPQRVYDYLHLGRIDEDSETMFAGIRQVQPAHYAEVPLDAPGEISERPYWRLEPQPVDGLSLEEAAARLRELYLESVHLHLRSDVPVGVAFSGGVDSSANVTAMRFLTEGDLALHTFSYVPDDPRLSEERWISLVARETGVASHTVTAAPQDLRTDLDRLVAIQGEPFNSTSIYAQYRVFKLARENEVKVMLDGQGADELFAGYRSYLPARLTGLLCGGRFAAATRFLAALSTLPGASARATLRTAVRRMQSPVRGPARRLARHRSLPDWLDGGWLGDRGVVLGQPFHALGTHALHRHLLESVQGNLRTLLRYEDRNSMASSIESRVPFLTPALVEFAAGLPDDYLLAPDGTGKRVLKLGLRGLVPDPILDRRDKIGFATPELTWLRSLGTSIDSALDGDAARSAGPLRISEVRRHWHAMRDGAEPYDPMAWRWLNLILWIDRFDMAFD